MSSSRYKKRKLKSQVYINIAPLVDVMLVLMVIFMITSQITTVGIQVSLPRTSSKSQDSKEIPVVISIDKDAKIYVEEANVSIEDLIKKLPTILKNSRSDVVYIRGDKNLNYGTLMEIMGVISSSGAFRVSLIAEKKNTR
jgi:biopolymer transport protein TolR